MENMVIQGSITATSNKVSTEFKAENPSKTVYIVVDESFDKEMQAFGLTRYTSKEDGKPFYIVKASQKIALYASNKTGESPESISGSVDTPNFKTADNVLVKMNLVKGNKNINDFYRLQAIQISGASDIENIEQQNPFA